MASEATAYLANKLLDHVFKNTAYTAPTSVYVGLSTNGSSEISGSGYARASFATGAASSSAASNASLITFTTPTASWGTISHAAVFDAASSGNQLTGWKTLAVSKTVAAWDTFSIAAGDLDLTA